LHLSLSVFQLWRVEVSVGRRFPCSSLADKLVVANVAIVVEMTTGRKGDLRDMEVTAMHRRAGFACGIAMERLSDILSAPLWLVGLAAAAAAPFCVSVLHAVLEARLRRRTRRILARARSPSREGGPRSVSLSRERRG
jgi:hypothetical protein